MCSVPTKRRIATGAHNVDLDVVVCYGQRSRWRCPGVVQDWSESVHFAIYCSRVWFIWYGVHNIPLCVAGVAVDIGLQLDCVVVYMGISDVGILVG